MNYKGNFKKKMNRQNYSSKDTIGQDNKNVKGFWPTDFNQRSAPEQYKEEEQIIKMPLRLFTLPEKQVFKELSEELGIKNIFENLFFR